MYSFLFHTRLAEEISELGLLADYDFSTSFSDFCEEIYKSVPDGMRLKAGTLVIRLPVDRPISVASRGDRIGKAEGPRPLAQLLKDISAQCRDPKSALRRRFGHTQVRLLEGFKTA